MSQPPDSLAAPRRLTLRWIGLILALLAAIIIPFVLFESQISTGLQAALDAVREAPWLGGGLIVALLTGDVVLPVPSSVISTFAGAAFGWKLAALIIWIGMTLGCVAGYLLGASAGRGVALRVVGAREMARAQRLFENVGPAALIVTRAVPVLAEAGTLAAGAARMAFAPFLVSTAVANLGVALAYAGIGAATVSTGSFLVAFLGLAAIPALAWTAWRVVTARRAPHR